MDCRHAIRASTDQWRMRTTKACSRSKMEENFPTQEEIFYFMKKEKFFFGTRFLKKK
jgi:hypothetical protein